ncbi:hypothetical protein NIES4071_48650 [Calothrix sp. NIES-4071]|nr:hypothetical protein NIES4071_48650 [Calothrix sp. NIES-4071]BAZ59177.1 hypothetical protein NIES4105_48590 [Calothrix sp. NIES-4105]
MIKQKLYLHYQILLGVILLGALLRFWNLDFKPLWMDEVITAIFSLGKNYKDLPLDRVFPLISLTEIFTYQPGKSCHDIALNLISQSTHPPLFFCTMYTWLGWLQHTGNWIAKLRFLPALFGVATVFVIYWVNRIAFSWQTGLAAAACMAVSPFAVYLSQEARHYTLPMLLISLALLFLVQIQKDIFLQRVRVWVWCSWAIVNSVSLYVHYFCILALVAQIATLVSLLIWQKVRRLRIWFLLTLSTTGIIVSFLPWLMVMLHHSKRSETTWLEAPQHIAPFYQTIINWILMVIAFPVEQQPILTAIVCAVFMLFCGVWVGTQAIKGLKQLLNQPDTQLPTLTLLSFSVWVILEFFAIIYLTQKDITVVPRYNFVYYPGFCAILAVSLVERGRGKKLIKSPLAVVLFIGVVSCIFSNFNLVFQKPFQPELVARNFNQEPSVPLMVVVGYSDYQDVALGLSFGLALQQLQTKNQIQLAQTNLAFFDKKLNFQKVIDKLAQLPPPQSARLNLWVVASGLRRRDFPQKLNISSQATCNKDDKQYYRIGIPYQLYRCDLATD